MEQGSARWGSLCICHHSHFPISKYQDTSTRLFIYLDVRLPWIDAKTCHLLCSTRVVAKFNSLVTVNYGGNARQSDQLEGIGDFVDFPGYPAWDPDQFMAWSYLPSIKSLSIWLRSVKDLVCERSNLRQLHTLLLVRETINETDVLPLLAPNYVSENSPPGNGLQMA